MAMELQLGLALSSNPMEGFDLNARAYEPKEIFGLDLWNHQGYGLKTKRSFGEAFEQNKGEVPQTLSLLFWDDQPNEEDDPKDVEKNSFIMNKNDGDENVAIGWPPIKSWRKKLCHQILGGHYPNGGGGGGGDGGVYRGSNSTFVKVKMEGVGIARKVDLRLHNSFETLLDTLLSMFGKCNEDANAYQLTYQDGEGDWLLVGDVPWRTFIGSVQRLKLLKNSS